MTPSEIVTALQQALVVALVAGGPILVVTVIVGLVISVLQAATQVHEATLTFVPKIGAVVVVLVLFGPAMLGALVDFARSVFLAVAEVAR
jgi:flagellar biosynthetic protein FliQ